MIFAILFSFYWAVAGFTCLVIVANKQAMGVADALICVLFGGVIVPAAYLSTKVMK